MEKCRYEIRIDSEVIYTGTHEEMNKAMESLRLHYQKISEKYYLDIKQGRGEQSEWKNELQGYYELIIIGTSPNDTGSTIWSAPKDTLLIVKQNERRQKMREVNEKEEIERKKNPEEYRRKILEKNRLKQLEYFKTDAYKKEKLKD